MGEPVRYLNPSILSVPTGYSHVVEVHSGRTIYIAGQVAFDQAGNVVGKGDFAAQTTQVFENLKLALAAAGALAGPRRQPHVHRQSQFTFRHSDFAEGTRASGQ